MFLIVRCSASRKAVKLVTTLKPFRGVRDTVKEEGMKDRRKKQLYGKELGLYW